MLEKIKQWDTNLFLYLNNSGIEALDGFWLLVTKITFWIPLFVFLIYLIFRTYQSLKARWILFYFLSLVVINLLLMVSVKSLVARLRPNNLEELTGLVRILQNPDSYSFYSGHASSSFAIAIFAFLVFRKNYTWFWLVFVFPILFTLSRIYVGVHFPIDLLVGATVGIILAAIGYQKCRIHINKLDLKTAT